MSNKPFPFIPFPKTLFGMPELTKAEVMAIKSLGTGTANAGQQTMALEVIVKKLSATYEVCADPLHLQMHEGRRMVGSLITQVLTMTIPEEKK